NRARREAADPRLAAGGESALPARVRVSEEVLARVAVRAVLVDLECGFRSAVKPTLGIEPWPCGQKRMITSLCPQAACLGGVAERVAGAPASARASAETPISSVRRTAGL